MNKEKYTSYEETRILGARALQIAMDAPFLMDIPQEELESIKFNPIEIARIEFENNILPITVNKPMPEKRSVKIKKVPARS